MGVMNYLWISIFHGIIKQHVNGVIEKAYSVRSSYQSLKAPRTMHMVSRTLW